MKQLMADGKNLQTADKVKLQDYTLRNVRQQVRKEQGGDDASANAGKPG
ncbi:hypothetical protein KB206_04125 [Microvirga sp. STS02]|nr:MULTISPECIES: hypothetical protein [Bacteria]MBH8568056.1 hypothetical protein [Hymenobacter negativus]MBR7207792.1 hypothetical protein [Microvirga sp. STS02]